MPAMWLSKPEHTTPLTAVAGTGTLPWRWLAGPLLPLLLLLLQACQLTSLVFTAVRQQTALLGTVLSSHQRRCWSLEGGIRQ